MAHAPSHRSRVARVALLATWAAGVGLFALSEVRLAGGWGFPLDDTWIHFQFARNLAAGHGFSFSPPALSAGSTAPLWTLVLAALFRLPVDPVLAAKAIGALLLLLAAALTLRLARGAGHRRSWALLAGLAVLLTPRLLWASLSGMEVVLYTTLATAGIWLHVRAWGGRPSLASTLLLTLAGLARPECLVLFPLAVLDGWRRTRGVRTAWRLYRIHVLLFVALLLPWAGLNWLASGGVLPGTYYAKVGGYGLPGALADLDLSRTARALLLYPVLQAQELAHFAADNSVVLACLVPLGLVAVLRGAPTGQDSGPWLPALVLVSFPLLRGMLAPFKGPTFQHGRYAAHLVPLLAVLGLDGLRLLRQLLVPTLPDARRERLLRVGRVGLWAAVLGSLVVVDLRQARDYGREVADIQRMHVATGRWLADHTRPDAVVAASDIGAVAFFSGRRVLDIVGLVTPQVLGWLKPGVAVDAGVLAYLRQARPDYLVVLPNWYPELVSHAELFAPVYRAEAPGSTITGGPVLVVYRTAWADSARGPSAASRQQDTSTPR